MIRLYGKNIPEMTKRWAFSRARGKSTVVKPTGPSPLILGHTHILGGPIKWDLERVLRLTANRAEEQVSLEGAMSMSPVTPTANVSFLLHVMWKTEGTS